MFRLSDLASNYISANYEKLRTMHLRAGNQPLTIGEFPVNDTPLVTPLNAHEGRAGEDSWAVLHVDDEPEFADMVSTFLEKFHDGFSVVTAQNADEGLDRLERGEVDCIVSDYQMPGKDGLDLLEAVRAEDDELPFILFTGKGSEEIASDAIAAGVTDYLQKRGGTDQYELLANRVKNAIDQYRTAGELWTALSWYQRLVEQELTGVYIVQDAEFVYVNAKFADIFGYPQSELIGTPALEIVTEEDRATVRENLHRRIDGEVDSVHYSFTGQTQQGGTVDLEVHGGVIEFDDEPAILGTLLDINDRPN